MREDISKKWNELTAFKMDNDGTPIIPPIPKCDKDEYINIIVPALIRCGAIPKEQLKIGHTYIGDCRNASEAVWNGEKFIYKRYKWGSCFEDTINHFQDDNGYDLFVPIKEKI